MCTQIEMLLNKCMAPDSFFFFFLFPLPPPSSLSQFQQKPCLGFSEQPCTKYTQAHVYATPELLILIIKLNVSVARIAAHALSGKITSVLCTANMIIFLKRLLVVKL